MARTVADVAPLLTAMAGSDAADPATADADAHLADYSAALAGASLRGMRLGVVAPAPESPPTETEAVFAKAVDTLKRAGAEIVVIEDFKPPPPEVQTAELTVLEYELKADLNAYLAGLPMPQNVKTLADVIAFNKATARETALFGQELFEAAEATHGLSDPVYLKAHDALRQSSRGILDKLFTGHRLDALIRATDEPRFASMWRKATTTRAIRRFFPQRQATRT